MNARAVKIKNYWLGYNMPSVCSSELRFISTSILICLFKKGQRFSLLNACFDSDFCHRQFIILSVKSNVTCMLFQAIQCHYIISYDASKTRSVKRLPRYPTVNKVQLDLSRGLDNVQKIRGQLSSSADKVPHKEYLNNYRSNDNAFRKTKLFPLCE